LEIFLTGSHLRDQRDCCEGILPPHLSLMLLHIQLMVSELPTAVLTVLLSTLQESHLHVGLQILLFSNINTPMSEQGKEELIYKTLQQNLGEDSKMNLIIGS